MAGSMFWSFLEQGGAKAIQLVVQIVLARLLAPDAFGVLAILLVVTQIADSIAQSGLGMALIQKEGASDEAFSTAWWLSLAIAACLYIAIVAASPFIAVFYSMPDLESCLKVLGLSVLFNSANSIQRSYLQKTMSFEAIFKASTIAVILSGAAGIALAYFGFGVWALVAQVLLQGIFICIVMWVQIPWHPRLVFVAVEAKDLFGYGWKICITGILNVLYTGISELIIGRTCTSADLGIYSQGRKYPSAGIGVLNNAVANVLFPAFSAIKNNRELLQSGIKKSLMLGSFVIVPIAFLAAVLAEPLVAILLTEKWLPCVLIFQLMCVSSSVTIMQLVNLRAYMALGDSALYLRLNIIKVLGGGVVIWATAALSRDIYATAVAAFVIGVLSVVVVDMAPAKRLHGYGAFSQLRDVLPIFLLSAVASGVAICVQFVLLGYLAQMFAQIVVFASVYLLGAKILNFPELDAARNLAKSALGRSSQ